LNADKYKNYMAQDFGVSLLVINRGRKRKGRTAGGWGGEEIKRK
jgi:hypothetical protein